MQADLFRAPAQEPPPLRAYQAEANEAVLEALAKGVTRQVVSIATGGGKTQCIARLLPQIPPPRPGATQSLVLAHRIEIIDQLAERIHLYNPDLSIAVEMAEQRAAPTTDVVVASVATLGREGSERIRKFSRNAFKAVVVDECVAGDTIVVTDVGPIRIDALRESGATQVLSSDGQHVTYGRVLRWKCQGLRRTLTIKLASGQTLQCTANHPIRTPNGWIPAGSLRPGFLVCCAPAAAVGCSVSPGGGTRSGTWPDIGSACDVPALENSGGPRTMPCGPMRRSVAAAVEVTSSLSAAPWSASYEVGATASTPASCMDMTSVRSGGTLSSPRRNEAPCWALCSETPFSSTRIGVVGTPASSVGTALHSRSGLTTRRDSCIGLLHGFPRRRTAGGGTASSPSTPGVCPVSQGSMTCAIPVADAKSHANGWMSSECGDWPGGSATMAPVVAATSSCAPTVSHSPRWRLFKSGWWTPMAQPTCGLSARPTDESSMRSTSPASYGTPSGPSCSPTSHPACTTNWAEIVSIETAGQAVVYDISVEGTECFFANGMLVHNCHHAVNATYTNIVDYFGIREEGNRILLVGYTATVRRGDGIGLEKCFDEVVYHRSLMDLVEAGWLCRLRALRISTTTDISRVASRAGDFVEGELASTVNTAERNALVVQAWKEHARDRRSTLCFCVNIQHGLDLRDAFRDAGVDAHSIDSRNTSKEERAELVARFRAGKLPVLVSVGIFLEGTDVPNIDCLLLARPTKSATLLTQATGRGMRLYPGKPDCLALDFVDVFNGKNLQSLPSLFGLPDDFDFAGEDVVEVYHEVEELLEKNPTIATQARSLAQAQQLATEEFDPFAVGEPEEAILEVTKLRWMRVGEEAYRIDLGTRQDHRGHLEVRQDLLGHWVVTHHHGGAEPEVVRRRNDLSIALQGAEAYIRQHHSEAVPLLLRAARWTQDIASPAQVDFLRKLKIPGADLARAVRGEMSKGEAAKLIEQYKLMRQQYKAFKQKARPHLQPAFNDVRVGRIGGE